MTPDTLTPIQADLILTAFEEVLSGGPTPAQRDAAPHLTSWHPVLREMQTRALCGVCPDHPELLGQGIVTSRLLHLDPARGLARTLSRWYRLGPPLEATRPEVRRQAGRFAAWPLHVDDLSGLLAAFPSELSDLIAGLGDAALSARMDAVVAAWSGVSMTTDDKGTLQ